MIRILALLFFSLCNLSAVEIYQEGIRFHGFKQIREELNETATAENGLYSLHELWSQSQHLASFSGSGNSLKVYKINSLYPKLAEKLSRADYLTHKELEQDFHLDKKSTELWIEKVTGEKIISYRQQFNQVEALHSYRYYKIGENNSNYAFLFKYQKNVYLFNFNLTSEQRSLHHKILKNFLVSLRISGKQQASLALPLKIGTGTKAYQQTLDKVKKSIAGKKGWWVSETKNYIVKSNLSKKKRKLADEILLKLEIMRTAYERFLPSTSSSEITSVVTILKSRQAYLTYAPDVPKWSAGVWRPRLNELCLFVGWSETAAIQTLYHEAFQQYLHYLLRQAQSPSWFNEGHAEFFEPSKFSNGGREVHTLESPEHRKNARKLIGKKIKLSEFLYWDYKRFYQTPNESYSCAWAVVYFLRRAGPLHPGKNYELVNQRLLTAILQRKSWQASVDIAFDGIDIDVLQKDLVKFLNSSKLRKKAQTQQE